MMKLARLPTFRCRTKSAIAPSAFKSFDSNNRNASASEMRSPRDNFVVNVTQFAALNEKIHNSITVTVHNEIDKF